MNAYTIQSTFNDNHDYKIAHLFKKLFYAIITLGCGKPLSELRDSCRIEEAKHALIDINMNLQSNAQTLYLNQDKNYNIVLKRGETTKLVLSTGVVGNGFFDKMEFKAENELDLIEFKTKDELDNFKRNLDLMVRSGFTLSSDNIEDFIDILKEASYFYEANISKNKENRKLISKFHMLTFNPRKYASNKLDIKDFCDSVNGNDYRFKRENGYLMIGKSSEDKWLYLVESGNSGYSNELEQQIIDFFAKNSTSSLTDFLDQSMDITDSAIYKVLVASFKDQLRGRGIEESALSLFMEEFEENNQRIND